jgi:hypothetical protein
VSVNGVFVCVSDDQIRSLLARPDEAGAFLRHEGTRGTRSLNIDKSWHALHWLLNGSEEEGDWPLCFIVAGGAEIETEDVGYGLPRAFTSEQVHAINAALAPIATADLFDRFDGRAMNNIYPDVWDRPEEREGNLKYLASHFDRLQQFVAKASARGLGIIAYAS